MDRWNLKKIAFVENKKIDLFLKEISEVCKRHNMAISHEDGHGSFEIETYTKNNIEWLMSASDNT